MSLRKIEEAQTPDHKQWIWGTRDSKRKAKKAKKAKNPRSKKKKKEEKEKYIKQLIRS